MISPASLTIGQKEFLRHRFDLNVDRPRPYRRYPRVHIVAIVIMPLLVAGLLFLDAPEGRPLIERPTEFVLWCIAIFLLIGEPIVFAWLWYFTRKRPEEDGEPSYEWRVLFRDRIRERRRWPLQWPLRICTLAMLAAAVMTGRPALAAALAGAQSLTLLRHVWQDRAIAGALDKIENDCATGEAK